MSEAYEPFTSFQRDGSVHVYDRFGRCILISQEADRGVLAAEIRAWAEEAADAEGPWLAVSEYRLSADEWVTVQVPSDTFDA